MKTSLINLVLEIMKNEGIFMIFNVAEFNTYSRKLGTYKNTFWKSCEIVETFKQNRK